MKLSDISTVSSLNNILREAQNQIKALENSNYKKGAMVVMWHKDSVAQQSFNIDLDEIFVESLKEALQRRIESVKTQIQSYGVEL